MYQAGGAINLPAGSNPCTLVTGGGDVSMKIRSVKDAKDDDFDDVW